MDIDTRDLFEIPVWLQNHPELLTRRIVLQDTFKPFCVWRTNQDDPTPPYAVKILDAAGNEADIYDYLHQLDLASPNHTLPCDVIHSEHPILIMPCLWRPVSASHSFHWRLNTVLDFFHQVLEGIDYLRSLRIAHMDLYLDNIVIATQKEVSLFENWKLQAGKAYIIDFDRSRRLPLGPGRQHAVELPDPRYQHPLGMKSFDPYSWDVYCAGKTFDFFMEMFYYDRPQHWIPRWFTDWLLGNERGCTTVCRCRPSARRALRVLSVVQFGVRVGDIGAKAVTFIYSVLAGGWRTCTK